MSRYRDYKQFVQGEFYHVYNRGNGKMTIFSDNEDFSFFIRRLKEGLFPSLSLSKRNQPVLLPENAFDLICYCLMPNHFHLAIRQNSDVTISKLMSKVCTSYSKYFNKKYERVGSIFQDQFKAVHVETNEQLLWLSVYIHKNPLVSNIVERLDSYEYSSYLDYIGKRNEVLCKKTIVTDQLGEGSDYLSLIASNAEGALLHEDLFTDKAEKISVSR